LSDGFILTDGNKPLKEGRLLTRIKGYILSDGMMLVIVLVLTDGMPLSEGFVVLYDGKLPIEELIRTDGMTHIDGFTLTDGTPLLARRLTKDGC
jgi:hypothetical protein